MPDINRERPRDRFRLTLQAVDEHASTMPRVILLGPRGSGKTTVGRALAKRLNVLFADIDADVQEGAGMTIADIFATEGEAGFRDRETAALHAAISRDCVIATGGGVVVREDNRRILKNCDCPRIYLDVDAKDLVQRVQADATTGDTRPALTALPPVEEVEHLLAIRAPLYEEVSTHRVAASGKPDAVLDRIAHILANASSIDRPTA